MPGQLLAAPTVYTEFLLRLVIDVLAIVIFALVIYYRRYGKKEFAVTFAFFNIGVFVVVTAISEADFALAASFGLFAMLSIIRLRSETYSSRELGYFFGALVLGVLNAISRHGYTFIILSNAIVIASIYILDHRRLFKSYQVRRVRLDAIYPDDDMLKAELESRLGLPVVACTVAAIDYVRDTMDVEVKCAERDSSGIDSSTHRGEKV